MSITSSISIGAPPSGMMGDSGTTAAVVSAPIKPATLNAISVNSANAAATYLLLWDRLGPTLGSDAPDYQFKLAANIKQAIHIVEGIPLPGGLSYAMCTTGGTAASGAPATPVPVFFSLADGIYDAPALTTSTYADPNVPGILSTTISNPLITSNKLDNDSDHTLRLATGAAATLYRVYVDNTPNVADDVYLKLYDAATTGAVSLGTTVPDVIIRAFRGVTTTVWFMTTGVAFASGVVYACVTAGGTGGTTSPTANVSIELGLA